MGHIPAKRDITGGISLLAGMYLIYLYHIGLYWGPLQTTPLLVNFRASHDSLDIWHHIGLLPTIILVINDCWQTILYIEGGFLSSEASLSRSNLHWSVLCYACRRPRHKGIPSLHWCYIVMTPIMHARLTTATYILYQVVYISGLGGHDSLYSFSDYCTSDVNAYYTCNCVVSWTLWRWTAQHSKYTISMNGHNIIGNLSGITATATIEITHLCMLAIYWIKCTCLSVWNTIT